MDYSNLPFIIPLPLKIQKNDVKSDVNLELLEKVEIPSTLPEGRVTGEKENKKIEDSVQLLDSGNFFSFEILVNSLEILNENIVQRNTEEENTEKENTEEENTEEEKKEEKKPPTKVNFVLDNVVDITITQEIVTPENLSVFDKLLYQNENEESDIQDEEKPEETIEETIEEASRGDDLTSSTKEKEEETNSTKCGTSILFPMSPVDLIKNLQRSPIEITAYRSFDDEINLDTILGWTEFPLGEEFCKYILIAAETKNTITAPKTFNQEFSFSLKNSQNIEVINMSITIQLICFGTMIITSCERQEEGLGYAFKYSNVFESFRCQQNMLAELLGCKKQCSDSFICPKPTGKCTCDCQCF